jgi:uncharacterized DUF497 family protein
MQIRVVVWDAWNEEHIARHGVDPEEVEEMLVGLFAPPFIQRARQGTYRALGQTAAGRYLAVFFALRAPGHVYPITARDMDAKERRAYQRHRNR